jgi:hypothetical protein
MGHRLVDLTLDVAVFPLQLLKMAGKRHEWCSFMVSSVAPVTVAPRRQ